MTPVTRLADLPLGRGYEVWSVGGAARACRAGSRCRLRFPHAQPFSHAIFNNVFDGLFPHGFPAEKQSFPAYLLNGSYTTPLRLVLMWSTTGHESSVAAKDRRDVAQPYAYWTGMLSWESCP